MACFKIFVNSFLIFIVGQLTYDGSHCKCLCPYSTSLIGLFWEQFGYVEAAYLAFVRLRSWEIIEQMSHLYSPYSQVHVSCIDTCNYPVRTCVSPVFLVEDGSPGHPHSSLRPPSLWCDGYVRPSEGLQNWQRSTQESVCLWEWWRQFWPNTGINGV